VILLEPDVVERHGKVTQSPGRLGAARAGSLFTSVLAVGALPDINSALADTPARVLWISNLAPQIPETAGMSAADRLAALRSHDVRVDAILRHAQLRASPPPRRVMVCNLPVRRRGRRLVPPACGVRGAGRHRGVESFLDKRGGYLVAGGVAGDDAHK
jgi:hypothetical protein